MKQDTLVIAPFDSLGSPPKALAQLIYVPAIIIHG